MRPVVLDQLGNVLGVVFPRLGISGVQVARGHQPFQHGHAQAAELNEIRMNPRPQLFGIPSQHQLPTKMTFMSLSC